MKEILQAYKYRLLPTAEQKIYLAQHFGSVRFVWNKLVENFNSWSAEHKPEKINSKTLKDQPEYSFLNEVSANIPSTEGA